MCYRGRQEVRTRGGVVAQLVTRPRKAHADKRRNLYNYRTNLISLTAQRGLKGVKGAKSPATGGR
nr:MAG: hypothetical protein DIU68_21375 [Chloroflexota bacterium]